MEKKTDNVSPESEKGSYVPFEDCLDSLHDDTEERYPIEKVEETHVTIRHKKGVNTKNRNKNRKKEKLLI